MIRRRADILYPITSRKNQNDRTSCVSIALKAFRCANSPTIFSFEEKANLQRLLRETANSCNTKPLTIITWIYVFGTCTQFIQGTKHMVFHSTERTAPICEIFKSNIDWYFFTKEAQGNMSFLKTSTIFAMIILSNYFTESKTSQHWARAIFNFLNRIGMSFPVIGGPLYWWLPMIMHWLRSRRPNPRRNWHSIRQSMVNPEINTIDSIVIGKGTRNGSWYSKLKIFINMLFLINASHDLEVESRDFLLKPNHYGRFFNGRR